MIIIILLATNQQTDHQNQFGKRPFLNLFWSGRSSMCHRKIHFSGSHITVNSPVSDQVIIEVVRHIIIIIVNISMITQIKKPNHR